jgi:hypothetical protein
LKKTSPFIQRPKYPKNREREREEERERKRETDRERHKENDEKTKASKRISRVHPLT